MQPIHEELRRRDAAEVSFLSCDCRLEPHEISDLQIPMSHVFSSRLARYFPLTDVFLETQIQARGPKNAVRVFFGHGQPKVNTRWPSEDMFAFDAYFLYGELERSMFQLMQEQDPESTRHIELFEVGYPKLDFQVQGNYNPREVLCELGLDPSLKTVIYAPAWDPGGALRTYGVKVAETLIQIPDVNIIINLHPVSLVPSDSDEYEHYTGGVDWNREFEHFNEHARVRYVKDYLINPLLVASDVMVTDLSGVALEFMTMDRPVIYIHCPEFYEKTLPYWRSDPELARDDERFNAGRGAGVVVDSLEQLIDATQTALSDPKHGSERRRALIRKFLYNPGKASEVAADLILDLARRGRRSHA